MKFRLLNRDRKRSNPRDAIGAYTLGLILTATFLILLISLTSAVAEADDSKTSSKTASKAPVITESILDAAGTEKTPFQKKMEARKSGLVGHEVQPFRSMMGEVTKGFLYVVAFVLIGAAIYRRFAEPKVVHENAIRVLSKRPVGNKNSLLLLEVDGQRLLVSESPDGVHLVSELTNPFSFPNALEESINQQSNGVHEATVNAHG